MSKSARQALEKIKPYLVESIGRGCDPDFSYRGPEDYGYFDGNKERGQVARLRLDWELAEPMPSGIVLPPEDVVYLMTEFLAADLQDLIINGDVENWTDPLLSSLNGRVKHGNVDPDNVDIFSAHLFCEYRPRKSAKEYTLYILLYVDFPDPIADTEES